MAKENVASEERLGGYIEFNGSMPTIALLILSTN
jgi:hypothetical protein